MAGRDKPTQYVGHMISFPCLLAALQPPVMDKRKRAIAFSQRNNPNCYLLKTTMCQLCIYSVSMSWLFPEILMERPCRLVLVLYVRIEEAVAVVLL